MSGAAASSASARANKSCEETRSAGFRSIWHAQALAGDPFKEYAHGGRWDLQLSAPPPTSSEIYSFVGIKVGDLMGAVAMGPSPKILFPAGVEVVGPAEDEAAVTVAPATTHVMAESEATDDRSHNEKPHLL